jgi:hypothetical protein
MTARELIAKLAALDPDARLFIRYPSEMGQHAFA